MDQGLTTIVAEVAAAVTAVAGAAAIFITKGVPALRALRVMREDQEGGDALLRGAQAISTLHTLMFSLGAHRAVMLRAHNGGGDLDPSKHIFSSVIFEARDLELPPVLREWQQQQLDADYSRLLGNLVHKEVLVVDPTKLEPESMLRQLYQAHGVTWSIVFKLWATPKDFYYVSVNFSGSVPSLEGQSKAHNEVRIARNALVRLLRDKETVKLHLPSEIR